jgi:sporulation protein YlmC with PRC-barrel domain
MRSAAFYYAFWALSALLFLVLCLMALPVSAADYNPKTEVIAQTNRINALQNPKYDRAAEVLGRRILDRKSKVVGDVNDIILNENGNISYLDVEFDRLQLRNKVYVNYGTFNIRPTTNGYAMTFDANEIESVYPAMLADIESAAGEEDSYSLQKLQGMEVWTESGRKIGNISDVLFGADGQRAELIYVTLSSGNTRGDGLAIPYTDAGFDEVASKRRITVADTTADAMVAFTQGQ